MKNKKIIRIIILILVGLMLLGFLSVLFINLYITSSTDDYILSFDEAAWDGYDCILVLGTLVYRDGTLSPMLKNRVDMAIKLQDKGVAEKLLMTGDHGREDYNEVEAMKNHAVEAGIDPDMIFMDHAGFSTYESMYRAKEVFECKKILIVTQEFHMARAVYLARALGLDAYGVCSDIDNDDGFKINVLRNYSREVLARVKDFFFAKIQPVPTYTGVSIPISGSGSQTND
ncbi:YdcF family protein [Eubacteriales bacterium OttesenSCG-928-G02]|nr:YdcF family protein [Eubacteriales bacterium OttesenSCG-928-G02]